MKWWDSYTVDVGSRRRRQGTDLSTPGSSALIDEGRPGGGRTMSVYVCGRTTRTERAACSISRFVSSDSMILALTLFITQSFPQPPKLLSSPVFVALYRETLYVLPVGIDTYNFTPKQKSDVIVSATR